MQAVSALWSRLLPFLVFVVIAGCGPRTEPLQQLGRAALAYAFTPATNVSNSPGDSALPDFAVDALGTVHVVWVEDWETVYSRSVDGGQTFSPFVQLAT